MSLNDHHISSPRRTALHKMPIFSQLKRYVLVLEHLKFAGSIPDGVIGIFH